MPYLDFNATTPPDQAVLDLFAEVAKAVPGNPASEQHALGQQARSVVDQARQQVADAFGVGPSNVVWTSGATESLYIAILSFLRSCPAEKRNIVIASTEHKAALAAADLASELFGARVDRVPCDGSGVIRVSDVEHLMDASTALVCVMGANNETGVINPVDDIGSLCRQRGVTYLCDATQMIGKASIDRLASAADMVALSGHKVYGVKGTGALLINRETKRELRPMFSGGGQESSLRGGTLNVPGVASLGLAVSNAVQRTGEFEAHNRRLSQEFVQEVRRLVLDVLVIGDGAERVANTNMIRVVGADAEAVMANMPNVHVSTGSACNSAVTEPSHVLLAMGLSSQEASECLRFSFGKDSTITEIKEAAVSLADAAARVRSLTEVRAS